MHGETTRDMFYIEVKANYVNEVMHVMSLAQSRLVPKDLIKLLG